jgi:hypothetical protein
MTKGLAVLLSLALPLTAAAGESSVGAAPSPRPGLASSDERRREGAPPTAESAAEVYPSPGEASSVGAAPSPRLGLASSDELRREGAPPTAAPDDSAAADPNAPAADAGDGSARAGDSADDGSPFDYQASEEISEDLSVSFPVDI